MCSFLPPNTNNSSRTAAQSSIFSLAQMINNGTCVVTEAEVLGYLIAQLETGAEKLEAVNYFTTTPDISEPTPKITGYCIVGVKDDKI